MNCTCCGTKISDKEIAAYLGGKGGVATTPAKQRASRKNGRLGGRPRKRKREL